MQNAVMQTFEFHGDQLSTFKLDDEPYVAMRPVVEGLGLSWGAQQRKIGAQMGKFSCTHMSTTGKDGKVYSMLSMPTQYLPLWLATINPNKIKDKNKRRKIELYQKECALALHNYWHKGVAIKDDHEGVVTELDPKVMQAIGGMVKGIMTKALSELVPAMVQQQLADNELGIVRGVTSYDVVEMAGIKDRKGLRGLGGFVSRRLTKYHMQKEVPVKLRDYGAMVSVRVFDKVTTKEWLAEKGRDLIRDYVEQKRGQPKLRLVEG